MLEQFQWLPFLAAITLLTMSPGVDTIIVMRNSAVAGYKKGLLTSLGICLGLFGHAAVSALGLSVILLGSASMFTALKLAGAAYLIYLGYQSLKSAARPTGLIVSQEGMSALSHFAAFRQGLLSNVLNPKPIIFYMAFLPQFINPEYSALQQSLFMAFMHFSIAMIWQGVLALLVHRAKTWLAKPQVSRVIDGLSGTLLLGFGTRLALQES
ncbi:threonine transporter RhtB [Marinomonas sp. S3726]|jgi:RhtB (resistance to homoserine/threonine) family protein|uniref:LysE family translocator n=1 Tax=Marinomonas sp. S3726 TaxID=579484 RepID=UPI0005FA4DFB|nr:LysE family translocator [Marinomonas sp. S3726]KJZ15774.1 threonine transporter RhtB [Marinomonas sp. S3726]